MINLQTGKTIDMIQSRNKEDVAQWLKGFPNIEYISRDGSNVYKVQLLKFTSSNSNKR